MKTRILSAVIGAPLVVGAILWPGGGRFLPGWPCALFVLTLVLVGLREFYDGCRAAGYTPRDGFGWAAGVLFLLSSVGPPLSAGLGDLSIQLGLTALVMASLAVEALSPGRAPLKTLAPTWLGAVYVGWLFSFVLRLRLVLTVPITHPTPWEIALGPGAWLVLFTLLVTTAIDSGAYFVGKSMGRHKLAPEVSPGKTWEGAAGGFVCGLIVSGAAGAFLQLPLAFSLTAGAFVGVLAQLGDLSKSAVKREIGIKDFGTLIPGHGGVLDRFDSLLFAAPAVYWLVVFWR